MGNPFVHLDLATKDVAAAKQFYSSLFDWKLIDMPGMGYVGIDPSGGVGGGMAATSSPDQPTVWTAYVDVADVRATISKAQALGAKILVPWMEVGTMGWLGVFMDPQGATIGVWQSASPPPAPAAEAKPKKAEKKAKKAEKKAKKAEKKAAKPPKAEKKAAKKAAKVEKKAKKK